jgi:hypothetical protein
MQRAHKILGAELQKKHEKLLEVQEGLCNRKTTRRTHRKGLLFEAQEQIRRGEDILIV